MCLCYPYNILHLILVYNLNSNVLFCSIEYSYLNMCEEPDYLHRLSRNCHVTRSGKVRGQM